MKFCRPLLNVHLDIGGANLRFRHDLGGKWKVETKDALEDEKHIGILKEKLKHLRADLKNIRAESQDYIEQQNMLKFKNQLLSEMVAVAQLDAEESAQELEEEKMKTDALKKDLAEMSKLQEDDTIIAV